MTTYDMSVAFTCTRYGSTTFEAESDAQAIEFAKLIAAEQPLPTTGMIQSVDWDGPDDDHDGRIVDVTRLGDSGDVREGEVIAQDIRLDEPEPDSSDPRDNAKIIMLLANLLSEVRTDLTERGVVASVTEIVDKIDDVLGPFQDALEEAAQSFEAKKGGVS